MGGFGNRIGSRLTSALLVVDQSKAFTDSKNPLVMPVEDAMAANLVLLEFARRRGKATFFTTVSYSAHDLVDAGIWRRKVGGLELLREGSPRWKSTTASAARIRGHHHKEVCLRVLWDRSALTSAVAGDHMVRDQWLREGDSLDARQNGFWPVVVREAVTDGWSQAHEQALHDLDQKYVDVVSRVAAAESLGTTAFGS